MVINSYVVGRVERAVAAWAEAAGELASPPSTKSANIGSMAFVAARIALEDADAGFFDHSLLDLLYFPVSHASSLHDHVVRELTSVCLCCCCASVRSGVRYLCAVVRAHRNTTCGLGSCCREVFFKEGWTHCKGMNKCVSFPVFSSLCFQCLFYCHGLSISHKLCLFPFEGFGFLIKWC